MRTLYPVIIAIAFAVSFGVLTQVGFFAAWGADVGVEQGQAVQDKLNQSAEEVPVGEGDAGGLRGDASGTGDNSDIISMVVNGGQAIAGLGGIFVLLPRALHDLAYPFLGEVAVMVYVLAIPGQVIAGIGIIEWMGNREWT